MRQPGSLGRDAGAYANVQEGHRLLHVRCALPSSKGAARHVGYAIGAQQRQSLTFHSIAWRCCDQWQWRSVGRGISRADSSRIRPRAASCTQLRVGICAGALVWVPRSHPDHPCGGQAPYLDVVGCERRLHRRRDPAWSATMSVTSGPVEPAELSDPSGWAGVLLMGLVVIPTIHALILRGRVFEARPQHPAIVAASKPGNGGRRRGRSRPVTSAWPANSGSAAPTCPYSSTTAVWWTSTMCLTRSSFSCLGCLRLMRPR
jgi:hypothetical protein